MWVLVHELAEVLHQFVDGILHVSVSIVHPHLVLVAKLHVLFLGLGSSFIDRGVENDLVSIFDRQQVMGHGLIGEFMY